MVDQLTFRIRLRRDETFKLDVGDSIPMEGVTAITGPSGGGKTTLLRALAGLEPQAAARITMGSTVWEGEDVFLPPEARRVGFVFQDPYLFPHMTAGENLAYGARRRQVRQFDAIVDALDLDPLMNRDVAGLSGGEAQRVALGRALASDPDVLFLDEPLANLDMSRKEELLPYIARAVSEARVPALYVSHATDEITALADRVIGIAGGGISGWLTPPMRLMAKVIATDTKTMRLRLDGAPETGEGDITQPLRARVGERIGLGLPRDSVMLSATRPEASTALAILPAGVMHEARGLELDVWGQRLKLPHEMWDGTGARLWMSVLKVTLRPEGPDSLG